MKQVVVRGWSAWAPSVETRHDWQAWSKNPVALEGSGHPEARFVPALLRRRCSPLSRILLTVAFDCCGAEEPDEQRVVFGSRHGCLNDSIDMLEDIALGAAVSPAKFSHSVHNTQAGLFAIASGNRRPSSSVTAQQDTFACAYVEALTHLDREPERPVLLAVGDVPLVPMFEAWADEANVSHGLALLLATRGDGTKLSFDVSACTEARSHRAWPDAIEFLRFMLANEAEVALGARRCQYRWTRL